MYLYRRERKNVQLREVWDWLFYQLKTRGHLRELLRAGLFVGRVLTAVCAAA
jgi:hypothetical protein